MQEALTGAERETFIRDSVASVYVLAERTILTHESIPDGLISELGSLSLVALNHDAQLQIAAYTLDLRDALSKYALDGLPQDKAREVQLGAAQKAKDFLQEQIDSTETSDHIKTIAKGRSENLLIEIRKLTPTA